MLSEISQSMVDCHKDLGMHGPVTIKYPSDEAGRIREWTSGHVPGEYIWWNDRDYIHVMTTTPELLIQLKLMFVNP